MPFFRKFLHPMTSRHNLTRIPVKIHKVTLEISNGISSTKSHELALVKLPKGMVQDAKFVDDESIMIVLSSNSQCLLPHSPQLTSPNPSTNHPPRSINSPHLLPLPLQQPQYHTTSHLQLRLPLRSQTRPQPLFRIGPAPLHPAYLSRWTCLGSGEVGG